MQLKESYPIKLLWLFAATVTMRYKRAQFYIDSQRVERFSK